VHVVECPRCHRAAKKGQTDSYSVSIDFHGAGQDRSEVLWACYASIGGNSPSSERRCESRRASRRCRRSGGFGAAAADVGDLALCAVRSVSLCRTQEFDQATVLSDSFPPMRGTVRIGGMNPTRSRARQLRRNPTNVERLLWQRLRFWQVDGYKFRRQQPLGNYILDFVCLQKDSS
jgi:hypothetical protein